MAEGIVPQIKEGIADVPKTIMTKPIVAVVVGAIVLLMVLLLESFYPGLLTNPLKAFLRMFGAKV